MLNATGVVSIGYAAPLPDSKEYAPFLIVYTRLLVKLQTKFRMGKVQPIYFPILDDTSTFVLQKELTPEEDIDAVQKELNKRLQDALTPKLTQQDKQQTFNFLGMHLDIADVPDFNLNQNIYGLAFTIGQRHQLKINGKELRAAIENVTDADIQNLAKTILAPEKRVTVVVNLEE